MLAMFFQTHSLFCNYLANCYYYCSFVLTVSNKNSIFVLNRGFKLHNKLAKKSKNCLKATKLIYHALKRLLKMTGPLVSTVHRLLGVAVLVIVQE
jgi:hypothetical protein